MDKEQVSEISESDVSGTVSPGKLLSDARVKLGLSQQDIADKLYLRVSNIADIEQDKLDEKTSVTFIKGYVRLYAKHVGLDSQHVVSVFEQYHASASAKEPAKLQSFSRRVAKQAQDDRWMLVTYGIILLLVAGFVGWWYQQPDSDANETQINSETTSEVADPQIATPSVNQLSQQATSTDNTQQSTLDADDANDALEGQSNIVDEQSSNDIADVQSSPDSAVVTAASIDETEDSMPVELVFTFAQDCWMNLTDASGEAIAYGIKREGRVMAITGIPPFEVTLGAPQVVSITYDGEAVDMSRFDDGKTARFVLPTQE